MAGKVVGIYVAQRGMRPLSQPSAEVEANKGIVGDRYYTGEGTFSEKLKGNRKIEVTFIASEELDIFNTEQGESLDYGDVRRNIITQGIGLNDLIGKEFVIGSARFKGIERCEPCSHLAATVNSKVLPHLAHTGLRAAVLESGVIDVGNEITVETHSRADVFGAT